MLLKEQKIIEKISEIPVTLGDISESIFGGVNTKNILMHRLLSPEEGGWDSYYLCEGLCKPVFAEPEVAYPYVLSTGSEKFAFSSSPHYRFLLPYELLGERNKNEYEIVSPEVLKVKYPLAYRRILEFKNQFFHDTSPLNSADYGVIGRQFLKYLYNPKIIVTENYRLQAAYDSVGNRVFGGDSCGIVLKDPSKYLYITAILNSPIARLFPAICKSEMSYSNFTSPAVLGHFPIVFPDSNQIEDMINTISSYLMFLNRQIYAASDYGVPDCLQELTRFYEQISSLLILDTYFINDIDSGLLDALEENIHPYAGDTEAEKDDSLLNALNYTKEQILETTRFGKYRFKIGLPDILCFSPNSEE
jgi:hypothetical protein